MFCKGVDMLEKTETKKTEEPKGKVETFNFTRDGIVVQAKNLAEAEKLRKKTLTENKESNNG
jgi:hypothetical protein